MMQEQSFDSGRPAFHIVARRTSQANTIAPDEHAARASKARWWKLLERLSLILGLTGFSITSLVAGVGKYLDTMQALETLRVKIVQLEEKQDVLEKTNLRLENELNFMRGRLERSRAETQSLEQHNLARNEMAVTAPLNLRREIAPRPNESAPVETFDARAPLHIIDKLNMTISYAYRKARNANPNLAGRLFIKCVRDEKGNLIASQVLALDAELEEVAANVRDKVQRWNFPETVTGLEEGDFQKTYFLTPSGF